MVALLLAALNPRPALSLRLLIWRTPELPLGLWLGAGAGGGALLSASATALALRQGQGRSGQRRRGPGQGQTAQADHRAEPWSETWQERPNRTSGTGWFSRPPTDAAPEDGTPAAATTAANGQAQRRPGTSAGPERAPGEPAPTVAVPFRVLHRPSASSSEAPAASRVSSRAAAPFAGEAQAEPVAVADDWGQSEGDDW